MVLAAEDAFTFHEVASEGRTNGTRGLFELFGIQDDDGGYVAVIGLILLCIAVLGCFYCKVYDPIKLWCQKKYKRWCVRGPRAVPPPPPGAEIPPERNHWYLNKTLAIDQRDRSELGPITQSQQLQGGWYGAKNGGFGV